jgi:hypothetical protein
MIINQIEGLECGLKFGTCPSGLTASTQEENGHHDNNDDRLSLPYPIGIILF